jgi:TonB family protein
MTREPTDRSDRPRLEAGRARRTPSIGSADDSLESTLPPTPLKELLATDGAGIYVLTRDAALIEAIEAAGGDRFLVHFVPSFAALKQRVAEGECRIVLLDADLLGPTLRTRITELRTLEPNLTGLVAAPRESAETLMELLSARQIYRLLIKPVDVGVARLMLESAVGRHLQALDQQVAPPSAVRPTPRKPVEKRGSSVSSWLLAIAFVAVVVGGIFGGLGKIDFLQSLDLRAWVQSITGDDATSDDRTDVDSVAARTAEPAESEDDSPGPAEAGRTPSSAIAGRPVASALPGEQAGDPDGTDAAGSQPTAPPSTEGARAADTSAPLERPAEAAPAITDAFAERPGEENNGADTDVADGGSEPADVSSTALPARVATAETAQADSAGPEARARTASPVGARVTSADDEVTPPSPELTRLLTTARARLDAGLLVAPAGDSARDYVTRAMTVAPTHPDVLAMRTDLAVAVADAARVLVEAGDLGRAADLGDEAFRLGAPAATLTMLDTDIARAKQVADERVHADTLDLGLLRMRQNRLVEPEGDSALFYLRRLRVENPNFPGFEAAWSDLGEELLSRVDAGTQAGQWSDAASWLQWAALVASPGAVESRRAEIDAHRLQTQYLATASPASELRILASVQPEYPDEALRRQISGWVDAEFVVGKDGVPREAHVVAAEPPGWFEQSALVAVSGFRFEPFERDGRVFERRAWLRLRFDLR